LRILECFYILHTYFRMKFFKHLYLSRRIFQLMVAIILLFIIAQFYSYLFIVAQIALITFVVCFCIDLFIVFKPKKGISAKRIVAAKLSNGSDNKINLFFENFFPYTAKCIVIDEVPHQFQVRDINFEISIETLQTKHLQYVLRPSERGEYNFGAINVYVHGPLGLLMRKFVFDADFKVPVYPSIIEMQRYNLLSFASMQDAFGFKKIRKIGQSSEFEQIKEYVKGDNFKSINWKATARRNELMVNQFVDEKSQQIYNIVDMGRMMKSPFNKLALLDYAINASLALSNVALNKNDKVGLITFSYQLNTFLKASEQSGQLHQVLESLYHQTTDYLDSNFNLLYSTIRRKITKRSLVIFYTNFNSIISLKRQLNYLRLINKRHLLLVVFFKNTELQQLSEESVTNTQSVYVKTIAEKLLHEKQLIVKELKKYGIYSVLTTPENLTLNTINKYLELKSRNLI